MGRYLSGFAIGVGLTLIVFSFIVPQLRGRHEYDVDGLSWGFDPNQPARYLIRCGQPIGLIDEKHAETVAADLNFSLYEVESSCPTPTIDDWTEETP